VASTGLALAAILLGGLGAAAWWSMRTQQLSLEVSRQNQVRAIAGGLADAVAGLLAAGELSAARSIVGEAGRIHDLDVCRVVLGDGGIVASADTARINVRHLPSRFPTMQSDAAGERVDETSISVSVPVHAGDLGTAMLQVDSTYWKPLTSMWRAQAGTGVVGALALTALLGVYRRMRRRLRAMSAIRDALFAMANGQSDLGALRVSPAMGEEAVSWNSLLELQETQRRQLMADKARGLEGGRRGSGDLAGACDAMSQGLVLVDERGFVKYANGAAGVYLGVRRDDALGRRLDDVIEDERVRASVRAVTAGQARQRETIEWRHEAESGPTVLRFSVRPVRREDSAGAVVLIEDVTQQRIADESRNAFVTQATHELRTPLTNIRLYVEEAVDSGDDDPALRAKCLNVINLESRRLERIVTDMLSVAEIEAGTMSLRTGDVRLDALFDDLRADYQAQAEEKGIELSFELPPKLPVIQADRDKIVLALHNLIGNALKYTDAGGRVSVSVSESAGRLAVSVSDTGVGISEADAERVFDKFYRAKDGRVASVTGTGLGLTLARDVVRLHGGDIELESELNKGSRFTIVLPSPGRMAA
jgi:PAS domain S-box-containing protein